MIGRLPSNRGVDACCRRSSRNLLVGEFVGAHAYHGLRPDECPMTAVPRREYVWRIA